MIEHFCVILSKSLGTDALKVSQHIHTGYKGRLLYGNLEF